MSLLQYRCRRAGYAAIRFKYDSTGHSPAENAARLAVLIDALEAEHIHFICHSLGGLVLRQYLARFPLARPGLTVMLGTPNNSSQAARTVAGWPGGKRLLGKSIEQACSARCRHGPRAAAGRYSRHPAPGHRHDPVRCPEAQ